MKVSHRSSVELVFIHKVSKHSDSFVQQRQDQIKTTHGPYNYKPNRTEKNGL